MRSVLALVALALVTLIADATAADPPGAAPVGGPPTPASVSSLLKAGRYAEAESCAVTLVSGAERLAPPDSAALGEALALLLDAKVRARKDALPETRALAERAVRVNEAAQGRDGDRVAACLISQAMVLTSTGAPRDAVALLERALSIRERTLGADDPQTVAVVGSLGRAYFQLGDVAKSREQFERAVAKLEGNPKATATQRAVARNNLGVLCEFTGSLAEARPLYERAIVLLEADLGPDHPRVAEALENLGNLDAKAGRYDDARVAYERTVAIEEKALGRINPRTAHALSNLGALDVGEGRYEDARAHYEEALAIEEKTLGPDDLDLGYTLTNLGDLLTDMGDPRSALPYLDRAVRIREGGGDGERGFLAKTLVARADAHRDLGEPQAARADYESSLALLRAVYGEEHEEVARALEGYASFLAGAGDSSAARADLSRAVAIAGKTLGSESLLAARFTVQLARLDAAGGRIAEARSALERALAVQEKALGRDHPDVAWTVRELAGAVAAAGETSRALELAIRAENVGRDHLRRTFRTLSERQALDYASARPSGLDLALALAAAPASRGDVAESAWDALVRSRALVLDEMAARAGWRHAFADSSVAELEAAWRSSEQGLANLLVRGVGEEEPDRYKTLVDGGRAETERAERAFLEASQTFRDEESHASLGLRDVLAALPRESALVAFARFDWNLKRDAAQGQPALVAFVARAGEAAVVAVPLGSASAIDSLVAAWRRSVEDPSSDPRRPGEALRRAAWDPLAEHLAGAKRVFIVPDGPLHLVAFDALPLPGAKPGGAQYLVEGGSVLHVLDAERDLVGPADSEAKGRGLLALGDPDFDALSSASDRVPIESAARAAGAPVFRGRPPACDEFEKVRWERLAGTAHEASVAGRLWKEASTKVDDAGEVVTLTAGAASEAAFKKLAPGKRVVHVATHGFFLGEDCDLAGAGRRGMGGLIVESASSREARPSLPARAEGRAENPLHLSGLVLAGANHRAELARSDSTEDGILTAEEVAALDLRGTEWVVASACGSGVGEVRAGEGVFGLRRAFHVAGARTSIFSLWAVDDEATAAWMSALYGARLRDHSDTAEAVQRACLSTLQARRAAGASDHPFYWAAFVAAGDWR